MESNWRNIMSDTDRQKVFVKKVNCPYCDKNLDSAICSDGSEERPLEGDYTICFGCMEFCKFDKNLNLKKVNIKKISKQDICELLKMREKLVLAKKWHSELN